MNRALQPPRYPETRRVDHHDTYFGTRVADPYRWLEAADDPEVLAWTQAQHDLAHGVLAALPGRDEHAARLEELWNYPRTGRPIERAGRIFFTRNSGLDPQPPLFVREGDEERVLIDPGSLSEDGTIALMEWEPSPDGTLLAYAVSDGGTDWRTVRVLDVASGAVYDDELAWIKFTSIAWDHEGAGFFYSRFPEGARDEGEANTKLSHRLCYHRVGTRQADDPIAFVHPTLAGAILGPVVSDDGRYLVVSVSGDSFAHNRLWAARLDAPAAGLAASGGIRVEALYDELDASYEFVGTHGDALVLLTSRGAPHRRVVRVRPDAPREPETIVAESDDVISGAVLAHNELVVTRMHNAYDVVERFSLHGERIGTIDMPGLGSTGVAGAGSTSSQRVIYVAFTSFLSPARILRVDLETNTVESWFTPEIPGFDPDAYETTQITATSPDGTRVPVFVTAERGIATDGSHPTILYGYGGFDISMTPSYPSWLPRWLERGGVYAVAVLRGGGEFGETWHFDGMFEKKQNVFDDFAAAADELVERGYTSHERLAIEGGSNGGLLVAASMLQDPQKFGAVVCHVPVVDMLRFKHFTAGRYWTSEYGDAQADEAIFRALLAYSPAHNVRRAHYPPILIATADHDDRVVPMHSKKLAALLQAADETNVALLRIETRAGHGAGKPTRKLMELRADVLAFLDATAGS